MMKGWMTLSALAAAALGSAQDLGPTPYLSAGDSPLAGPGLVLENFEDGTINLPGVTANHGLVIGPSALTDSVDGDDGNIDGFGAAGYSWYSGGFASHTFTFAAGVLGALPTEVGLAVTDIGQVTSGSFGVGTFFFRAYDDAGSLIGSGSSFAFGDGAINGATAEDRFAGVRWAAGIKRIEFGFENSTDWEVDHIQYRVVPEPATFLGVLFGLGALARRARR